MKNIGDELLTVHILAIVGLPLEVLYSPCGEWEYLCWIGEWLGLL